MISTGIELVKEISEYYTYITNQFDGVTERFSKKLFDANYLDDGKRSH